MGTLQITDESHRLINKYFECYPKPERIDIKKYAQKRVYCEWDDSQWDSFNWIAITESEWNPTAQNPKSTAYGIGQFLNDTWGNYGYTKTDDPYVQIEAMIDYIQDRYTTPYNAKVFHLANGHY